MVTKAEIYLKLAKHARDDRDPVMALGFLEKALKEDPGNYQASMDLVKVRLEQKQAPHISVVLADVERAFLNDPSQVEPYTFIIPLLFQNKLPELETWLDRALVAHPDNVLFLNFAGVIAMETNTAKARTYFSKCLAQDPTSAEHHYNCGITYVKDTDFLNDMDSKAVWHFQMALCWKPDWIEAKRSLVEAYVKHSKFKEALAINTDGDAVIEALQIESKWRSGKTSDVDYDDIVSRVLDNTGLLGSILKNQTGYFEAKCDFVKAEKAYRHVYACREEYFGKDTFMSRDSALGLGQFLCKIGNWDEGVPILSSALGKQIENKRWDGKKTGHLVILNNTLGNGDQMFYSRYAPLAAALADKTTFVTCPNVEYMYKDLPLCEITSKVPEHADAWIDCSHLIAFFGPVPMIDFLDTKTNGKTGKALIHLSSSKINPMLNYRRDVPFSVCRDLVSDSKYTWISDAKQAEDHPNIMDLSETIDKGPESFKETIELLKTVDFVVTCDTFLAHLAGLMKRPTILILTTLSEFRWGSEQSSYPWYPTVKYWRQKVWGEWEPLTLQDVETILELN